MWQQMTDEDNDKVKLNDDGRYTNTHTHTLSSFMTYVYLSYFSFSAYMKLYQLQMKGKQIPGFDCILVDEAQDLTPGMQRDECKEGSRHRKTSSNIITVSY